MQEFLRISPLKLRRVIRWRWDTWTLVFGVSGIKYCAVCYALAATFVAHITGSTAFITWSSLYVAAYWGGIGFLVGSPFGVGVAYKAYQNLWKCEQRGLEPWKGISAAGAIVGSLLGIVMGIFSLLLPYRPNLGAPVWFTPIAFIALGWSIGLVTSRSAYRAFLRACGIRTSSPGCINVVAMSVFISVAITVLILFWTGIA